MFRTLALRQSRLLINKGRYAMIFARKVWYKADFSSVSPSSEQTDITHLNSIKQMSELRTNKRCSGIRCINMHPDVMFLTCVNTKPCYTLFMYKPLYKNVEVVKTLKFNKMARLGTRNKVYTYILARVLPDYQKHTYSLFPMSPVATVQQ